MPLKAPRKVSAPFDGNLLKYRVLTKNNFLAAQFCTKLTILAHCALWLNYVKLVVRVWVFESDVPAKTLGRDVILYAVRKQRG